MLNVCKYGENEVPDINVEAVRLLLSTVWALQVKLCFRECFQMFRIYPRILTFLLVRWCR